MITWWHHLASNIFIWDISHVNIHSLWLFNLEGFHFKAYSSQESKRDKSDRVLHELPHVIGCDCFKYLGESWRLWIVLQISCVWKIISKYQFSAIPCKYGWYFIHVSCTEGYTNMVFQTTYFQNWHIVCYLQQLVGLNWHSHNR